MSYAAIRDAIATVLTGVSNIGQVQSYARFAVDPATFLESFKTTIGGTVQIRAWTVTLERAVATPGPFGREARTYTFLIYGVMGLADAAASEETFYALTDAVLDALDSQTTLSVAGVVVNDVGPAALRLTQVRQFGSVLCHYAEIEYPVVLERAT